MKENSLQQCRGSCKQSFHQEYNKSFKTTNSHSLMNLIYQQNYSLIHIPDLSKKLFTHLFNNGLSLS